jgi:predicted amidophosphoribosyltransferase
MSLKLHPSVTPDRIAEACDRYHSSLDNPGFCIACGRDAEGVEPDARRYHCESCGLPAVYGAEELAIECF